MNSPSFRPHPINLILAAGIGAALAFRLWTSFCFFPLAEWNSARLAPTFMLWFGSTPYPSLTNGPLTTWIYGPVPLLLNLPALLASDTITALFIAETINLLSAVLPVAFAVFAINKLRWEVSRTDQIWAWFFCLALWPNSSLHYLQSDNVAVAFGLLSNVILALALKDRHHGPILALAGLSAALCVWSKQTSLGLFPAQWLWVALVAERRIAIRYAFVSGGWALALGFAFVSWFGLDELWLNLVSIPARLPFCESVWDYTREFWMQISGYVLLPAAALIVGRRAVWRRDSPWLLPALVWLALLPTSLVSIYRIGGATNSLNGFLYLLPLAAATAVARLRRFHPRTAYAWLAAAILAILTQQLSFSPLLPMRPMTTHLAEGESLARQFRGQIYFPWHPLLTFFSEGRFYHAEDGLYTRRIAGLGRDEATAPRDLPPRWSVTAIPGWRDQGSFKQLQPSFAHLGFEGKWTVYSWPSTSRPDSATEPGENQPLGKRPE